MCYNKNMKYTKKKFYMHKLTNIINIQKIVTIHYQALQKKYVFPEETHDFWEINYVDKDNIYIGIDGKKVMLSQGELILIKPNQPHFVESGNSEPNLFIISFACSQQFLELFPIEKITVPKKYRYLLQNIISEAKQTFDIPDFNPTLRSLNLKDAPALGGEQIIKNSLETLFIYLLRETQQESLSPEFLISKFTSSKEIEDEILRILNDKIYDKFKIEDLKEVLHYGKTQICTFFKKKTGKSIYQTYLKLKMEEAKKLIRKNIAMRDIANLLCFDSVSSFASAFKKEIGMTPKEYRNSIQ